MLTPSGICKSTEFQGMKGLETVQIFLFLLTGTKLYRKLMFLNCLLHKLLFAGKVSGTIVIIKIRINKFHLTRFFF